MENYNRDNKSLSTLLILAGVGLVFMIASAATSAKPPNNYDGSFNHSFNTTTTITTNKTCVGFFPEGC